MKHFICAFSVACAALCGQNATPPASGFVTGQGARAVFGQATFTAQDDASPQNDLGGASGLALGANMLFVVDSNRVGSTPDNNRVIIYQNISQWLPAPNAELNTIRSTDSPCPVCDNHQSDMIVLGQPDLTTTDINTTQGGFREPTAVATNGQILVVADTNNNRVLIWHTLPTTNNALPDTVLGQANFTSSVAATSQTGMKGPEGVWIQGSQLFVADTVNGRILVWNSIPAAGQNNQAADFVLGQPNFTSTPPVTADTNVTGTTASNMVSPVSVSSDGTHLFVSDLGQNRVMIWNHIPTTTNQPADVIVGQPDAVSSTADNSTVLCASNGTSDGTATGTPTYPPMCAATLDWPRFALSDGTRLFIADGGNDRVLVYNSIPTRNGTAADVVLGQPNDTTDNVQEGDDTTDTTGDAEIDRSGSDQLRTPTGLAWDGTNLYVSDPFDRRVVVFSQGTNAITTNGIVNAASLEAFAVGSIGFTGTVNTGNTITVTINSATYTYTTVKNDTTDSIVQALVSKINASNSGAGDPNVFAIDQSGFILLTSRVAGVAGNSVTYSATDTDTALTVLVLSTSLQGGTQSELAAGALVEIQGTGLADQTAAGEPVNGSYPFELAGVEVYFDGIRAPLLYVSPTQINAQIPFEITTATGITAWVRTVWKNGTVTNSVPQPVAIVGGDPGIFAVPGKDPRVAYAYHYSSYALAAIDLEGTTFAAGETITATINGVAYNYVTLSTDTTLADVEQGLINAINASSTAPVVASASGEFNRVILTAKAAGSAGNGITVAVSTSNTTDVTASALNATTCCASEGGTPVTPQNPAVPGETIVIYATGLGLMSTPSSATAASITGQLYNGPSPFTGTTLVNLVDDAEVGGDTANVFFAGLAPGTTGVYEVTLQLDSSLTTNPDTQVFIAQEGYVSNIVTIPVTAPASTSSVHRRVSSHTTAPHHGHR